jgi:nitroreductase
MDLHEAITQRRSVRGFRHDAVPRAVVERVFAEAQLAPSWCNIQPWRVWVATGPKRDALVAGLEEAARTTTPTPDVPFPSDYPSPYDRHRKECGKALYEAMGVARGDGPARLAAWMRNFCAFDAPVVSLVGIDARFGLYAALDVGCWLQTLLLAAAAEGLATCAMASLATYPDVARKVLGIPEGTSLLFGIALGYEDTAVAANACRTTRSPLSDNVVFVEDAPAG